MVAAPEYSLKTQAKFPPALAAIHNFIRIHDPDDITYREAEKEASRCLPRIQPGDLGRGISQGERGRATKRRDDIANRMWAQYVAYRDARDGN